MLIVAVTAGFAMAMSGMFQWMSWNSRQTVIADTFSSSSNLALSLEQFVARTMETVDLTLRIVTENIAGEGARNARDIQMLLADRIRQSPQITGLMVIGANGVVRVSSGDVPKPGTSLANSKYFITARGNPDIQLLAIDPQTSRSANKRLIFVARRFVQPGGAFGGVVAAMVSADYVQRFLSTLHVGAHAVIALQTADGTMLVRQPYDETSIGKDFASTPLFREWLPWASSGVFRAFDESDQVWRITAYQRVDRLPLVVDVALSEPEALTNWRRTNFWQDERGHRDPDGGGDDGLCAAPPASGADARPRAAQRHGARARTGAHGRRGGEPRQEPVHGEYEPRAAHTAQRRDRL